MANGDKPGQRTWYVGADDESPSEAPADVQSHAADASIIDDISNDDVRLVIDANEDALANPSSSAPASDDAAQAEAFVNDLPAQDSDGEGVAGGETAPNEAGTAQALTEPPAMPEAPALPDFDASDTPEAPALPDFNESAAPEMPNVPTEAADEPRDVPEPSAEATAASADDELESTLVHRKSLLHMAEEVDVEKDAQPGAGDEMEAPAEPAEEAPLPPAAALETEQQALEAQEEVPWGADDKPSKSDREEAIFEGATVLPAPPSRTAAHLWTLVLTIITLPVGWYLLWDAGTRLTVPITSQWNTGRLNSLALIELGGGCAALFILVLCARWSSLGTFIAGLALTGIGLPFVVIPGPTARRLDPIAAALDNYGNFGANIAHHIQWSGSTGFFVMAGLALIALGFVSHGARRKGRKDFLTKRKVDRTKKTRGIKG